MNFVTGVGSGAIALAILSPDDENFGFEGPFASHGGLLPRVVLK